jgi:hypothetical protein
VLINQAAPTPVAATNALGLLILRDVLEAANAIIDRLIIVPWRDAINIEFVQVLLAVRQSQKKYGTTPAETAQLVEDGLLPMIPTDRLTGEPIRILPEKNQIAGPELELIRTLMAYPLDAPEVRWRIPEIGQCLEK